LVTKSWQSAAVAFAVPVGLYQLLKILHPEWKGLKVITFIIGRQTAAILRKYRVLGKTFGSKRLGVTGQWRRQHN
jgi:putative effector of murein hydrolase